MELVRVRATHDQIVEFKKSILWADMLRELNQWRRSFKREGENIVDDSLTNNPSTASVLMHIGDINGRTKAVDYMKRIPDVFLSILEDQKDARRNETD